MCAWAYVRYIMRRGRETRCTNYLLSDAVPTNDPQGSHTLTPSHSHSKFPLTLSAAAFVSCSSVSSGTWWRGAAASAAWAVWCAPDNLRIRGKWQRSIYHAGAFCCRAMVFSAGDEKNLLWAPICTLVFECFSTHFVSDIEMCFVANVVFWIFQDTYAKWNDWRCRTHYFKTIGWAC
jgi:hypothetical protein